MTDFSSCASQRLPVEGAALRRLLARSYREPAIARAVNGIDGWFHPRERRRRPRRLVYVSIGSRLPHLLNLLVRLGHCGQPSNDEMVVVESDATQYLNHFRRMAVVLVADGPVRGIDLRETAVAVAVEFELVVAAQIRDCNMSPLASPAVNTKVSPLLPPLRMSAPPAPSMRSLPESPLMVSLPAVPSACRCQKYR